MQSRKFLLFIAGVMAISLLVGITIFTGGSPAIVVPIGAAIAVAIVVALIASGRRSRRRRQEDADAAASRLGMIRPTVDKHQIKTYSHLPEVPSSAKMAEPFSGMVGERALHVFESRYVVHTGQAAVTVVFSIYASDAPGWPSVSIMPRNLLSRLARRAGLGRGLQLDSNEFNRAFKVTTSDEDFAILLLDPAMQQFMLEKTNVRWHTGSGYVCLVYSGQLNFDRMDTSIERLARFWANTPEELKEAWA